MVIDWEKIFTGITVLYGLYVALGVRTKTDAETSQLIISNVDRSMTFREEDFKRLETKVNDLWAYMIYRIDGDKELLKQLKAIGIEPSFEPISFEEFTARRRLKENDELS